MIARYDGKCPCCDGKIRANRDEITVTRGAPAAHAECLRIALSPTPIARLGHLPTQASLRAAWELVTAVPATRDRTASGTPRRRAWRPCGYPGCNPQHCDECSE